MNWKETYEAAHARYVSDVGAIEEAEREWTALLETMILAVAEGIARDWEHAAETAPCWIRRAPKQRGRAPSGAGIPWLEVAEYVPMSHLTAEFARRFGDEVRFPGLPTGGDLRIGLPGLVLHLDAKAAGPNDRHDEVVVPPYQITGDGRLVPDPSVHAGVSVSNSPLRFPGRRVPGEFHPSLPPFYLYADGSAALCMTAFLKVVYSVTDQPGVQPLDQMVLAVVPNGILMRKRSLHQTPELLAKGKDDTSKSPEDSRCRVMFGPLAGINQWRVTKFARGLDGAWASHPWTDGQSGSVS